MKLVRARFALVAALLATAACAPRASLQPPQQGPAFTLEVVNTMPHAMNVSYELGTELTALGSVEPNQTRQFTIPNRGSDEVRVLATDQNRTHTVDKRLDLEGGEVVRWEIK